MKNKIKLGLVGYFGKMCRAITAESFLDNDVSVVGGLINKESKNPSTNEYNNIMLFTDMEDLFNYCDIIIDFTNPNVMKNCILSAVKFKKPLVSGTTGHNHHILLEESSAKVPIFWSPNMSCGINIIAHMFKNLSKNLMKNVDINISEIHHKQKKDSPSGTAIFLRDCIRDVHEKDININSIRLENAAGKHTILFTFDGESIEINHNTTNRKPFACGAINAAKWIYNKPSGLYSMSDLINH